MAKKKPKKAGPRRAVKQTKKSVPHKAALDVTGIDPTTVVSPAVRKLLKPLRD
jgi:hypothetical protein